MKTPDARDDVIDLARLFAEYGDTLLPIELDIADLSELCGEVSTTTDIDALLAELAAHAPDIPMMNLDDLLAELRGEVPEVPALPLDELLALLGQSAEPDATPNGPKKNSDR